MISPCSIFPKFILCGNSLQKRAAGPTVGGRRDSDSKMAMPISRGGLCAARRTLLLGKGRLQVLINSYSRNTGVGICKGLHGCQTQPELQTPKVQGVILIGRIRPLFPRITAFQLQFISTCKRKAIQYTCKRWPNDNMVRLPFAGLYSIN